MRNEEWIDVLLVEDEQTLAMIIKDTLEGQGFRIRLAKDGEEGLQCFFHEKPDVPWTASRWCAASAGAMP